MIEKEIEKKRERREMITRAKIVELLSERQIRSQKTPLLLSWFSPNPHISTRKDVSVALFYIFLFCFLVISSLLTFRYWFYKTSGLISFFGIFLLVCLKVSRHRKLKRKRERSLSLDSQLQESEEFYFMSFLGTHRDEREVAKNTM